MRRVTLVMLMVVSTLGLMASGASAASPHFKKGGEPVCTISGSGGSATVTCKGSLAGLGNDDLRINVTVAGFAVYQCRNQGGNIAPGQNKVLVGPTTTPTTIPSGEIKNGNLSFTAAATLTAPTTVSAADAGCPNSNWIGVNPTLTVTSISVSFEQPPGTPILTTCSASDPNGLTGSVSLTC
jgi:hypothetical protein